MRTDLIASALQPREAPSKAGAAPSTRRCRHKQRTESAEENWGPVPGPSSAPSHDLERESQLPWENRQKVEEAPTDQLALPAIQRSRKLQAASCNTQLTLLLDVAAQEEALKAQ